MAGASPGDANYHCQHILSSEGHAVSSLKFSPKSGTLLACASSDPVVNIFSTSTGEKVLSLTGHAPGKGVSDVSWNPNEKYLCTASDDNTLKLWDADTGTCLRTLTGHTNFVFCCNFDAQGHLLVSGSFDETLRLWDVRSGKCIREIPAHSDPLTACHFNYDGTLIVTSSLDGLIRLWDTQTGHCLKTLFEKDSPPVSFVKFSPNGKFLLCNTLDSRVRVWNYEKAQAVKSYAGIVNTRFCLASSFMSCGHRELVVCGSEDSSIHFWDLNSQQSVLVIPGRASKADKGVGHCDAVMSVDVHPTLPMVASGGYKEDSSVRLWALKDL